MLVPGASTADEATAPQTGLVEGVVTYTTDSQRPWRYGRYYIADKRTGALAEAVVCLSSPALRRHPPAEKPKTWTIDQKDHRFVPEAVVLRAGDRVKFLNSDPKTHNVHSNSSLMTFDRTLNAGQELEIPFDKPGNLQQPVQISCHLHNTMRSWIFVFSHPYHAVTSTDGKFRFANVPPGEYRIEMFHPAGGLKWSRPMKVEAGKPINVSIPVGPDDVPTN
ncbi:MAG: cupredoxin domain-containing protein [Planctomycetales bacterium]|nr:cupredoxin domain-containing protein [Planctomycetales bacterium]